MIKDVKGFTLLELMIAVSLGVILLGIGAPAMSSLLIPALCPQPSHRQPAISHRLPGQCQRQLRHCQPDSVAGVRR